MFVGVSVLSHSARFRWMNNENFGIHLLARATDNIAFVNDAKLATDWWGGVI